MEFQYTPYVIPLIIAAVLSDGVVIYLWPRRRTPKIFFLVLLGLAVAIWSLGYALEIAGGDLATKIFWAKTQYIGISLVPFLWMAFVAQYSNVSGQAINRGTPLLLIVSLVTVILAFTNERHGLLWEKTYLNQAGKFSSLGILHGPWFWIYIAYSYALLAIGTFIGFRSIGRMKGLYLGQVAALLIAVAAPWIGNILYISGLSPVPQLDLTPFAFSISVIAFAWGVTGFHLLDLSPIARDIVVEEMKTGMIVLDTQNRIVDANPASLKILNQRASQVLGQTITSVLGDIPNLVERYINVTETTEEISIGEGDSRHWYEMSISPIRDKNKIIEGRVVTIMDVSERKRTEILLQESEARYRQIVENAGDIIYRTDVNGYLTYVNQTALHLMRFRNEAELIGKHYLDFATPASRNELQRFYERQFVFEEPNTYFEFEAVRADGQEIWIGQNVQIIKDDGKVVGFQAVARDITELKQAREAMAFARDQALEASQLKSRLLAKVSHELRTPLSGILGFVELLQYNAFGLLNEDQKYATSQILESVEYLSTLIGDLLDEAQIEAKTIKLNHDEFHPSDVLSYIEGVMTVLAHNKGLSLITSIDPSLPGTLYGDEHRLKQILVNLVGNAIKFTEEGEVRVNLYRSDSTQWVMEVSDTGIGIPEDAQAYIFEPFRKVENKITHTNQGTGLGLAITNQLVELMGGQIHLESTVGQYSKFSVFLPIHKD
ncbi:MAG: PAS domain S-box protein [Anaerolineales bacterium]|nr:PAS domain S-box protein [Anaerolineales bacterium]